MRILTIAASLPAPGAPAYGVDAVFAPIVRHLVDAGHDVWVLTVESASVPSAGAPTVWPWLIRDCPDPDVLPAQWTATHKLQYLWKMRRNYRATRRALRLSKPDVVYYSDLGLLTAAPVGAVEDAGHPGVFHAHDWYALDLLEGARQPTPDGGVKGMVLSWAQRGRRPGTIGGARLLANSHYVMDRYVEAGWLPEMTKDFEGGKVDPARTDGLYLGPSRGHTIPRYAKLIGMPRGYGYGASMGAWVLDYVSNWGGEWADLQHADMKYRGPALTGDVTYLDGEVKKVEFDRQSGRPLATLSISMTNQLGVSLAVGEVKTLLPSETDPQPESARE